MSGHKLAAFLALYDLHGRVAKRYGQAKHYQWRLKQANDLAAHARAQALDRVLAWYLTAICQLQVHAHREFGIDPHYFVSTGDALKRSHTKH